MNDKEMVMPAAFLGHGSPVNAVEQNRYTEAWSRLGARVPRPRAILCISAHWYVNDTRVTAMTRPKTIHDFYGFPRELYEVDYPAPGDPDVAGEIAEVLKPAAVRLDTQSWGLDHGTWSLLVHAFPAADVPVLQLSIDARQPMDYHLALGSRLAPLRKRGIMIIASGNVVHNLKCIDWRRPDAAFDWNRRFDEAAREIMVSNPAQVLRLQDHDDFSRAAPSPEHFIPLLYVAGLADAARLPADVLVSGYALGSLSMTAYTLGDRSDPDA